MQVGLDKQTSANCKAWLWFRQDKHCSTLVLTSSKYFQSAVARADGILIPNMHKALYVSGNLVDGQKLQNKWIFFVANNNANRYRVSTKFTMIKIVVFIGLFSIGFNLLRGFRNDTFTSKSVTVLTLGTIALAGIFYFASTRKRIDYDGITQTLYIVDTKSQTETKIPVENIDKILYSKIGGRGQNSYTIVYHDFHNQKQKVRLFPIPFDNSIDTIITDTKFKNPALVTGKWSFGWNEFFD